MRSGCGPAGSCPRGLWAAATSSEIGVTGVLHSAARPRQIQRQQPLQNRLVAEVFGPAVGAEDCAVEGAVDVVEFLYLGRGDGLAGFLHLRCV